MVHHHGRRIGQFHLRLPSLGDGVSDILCRPVKSEELRCELSIQIERGAITGRASQGILIEEGKPMDEPLNIPLKGLGKRKEKVTKGSGHCMLVMGEARHDRQTIFFGPQEKSVHQRDQSSSKS
jgi:hypothetical protein